MHDRTALGPADVDRRRARRHGGRPPGHDPGDVELVDSRAEPVPYDLPAITTASRTWVSGIGPHPARRPSPVRVFVKHVQAWTRSPEFAFVPEELRELAAAGVPWRTEPLAYRSDLADRLPDGLHDAAGARRLRPRRRVRGRLARGEPARRASPGTSTATCAPPTCSAGSPRASASSPRRRGQLPVVGLDLRARAGRRRRAAPAARGDLARPRPARAPARGLRAGAGPRRGAARLPRGHRRTATPAPTTCCPGRTRTPSC